MPPRTTPDALLERTEVRVIREGQIGRKADQVVDLSEPGKVAVHLRKVSTSRVMTDREAIPRMRIELLAHAEEYAAAHGITLTGQVTTTGGEDIRKTEPGMVAWGLAYIGTEATP